MRRKPSRRARAVVTAAAAALVASGAVVTTAPAASAAVCDTHVHVLCGAVNNRTGRTMSITLNLGQGSGWCAVWNWDGGPGTHVVTSHCDQRGIGNGTVGGNGTGTDVDAFSFNNFGYHERFSRIGSWHWRTAGTWTKIRDGEIADCGIGDGNEIWCTVLFQA